MKVSEVIKVANKFITFNKNSICKKDLFRLLSHATGIESYRLILEIDQDIELNLPEFLSLIKLRLNGSPMSQIIGNRSFWKSDFIIDENVLDPRPESETILEVALQVTKSPAKILDLGTGSGCLACSLSLEYPFASVIAIDRSAAAIKIAKMNSRRLGCNIDFIQSFWVEGLAEKFDLIVCNPPYLSYNEYLALDQIVKNYEPQEALLPHMGEGCTGLESYLYFSTRIKNFLNKGGLALFEVGRDQAPIVEKYFKRIVGGYIQSHKDINGRNRVISVLNM